VAERLNTKKTIEPARSAAPAAQPGAASRLPSWLDPAFIGLAVVGLGISGYLAWAHFTYTPIICTADLSCDTVNRSSYAYFPPGWGIPVSYLGLVAYVSLLGLGLWRWRVARRLALAGGGSPAVLDLTLFVATLVGLIFSAYLTAMELFVIHAVCWWCVGSATVITLLFGIAVARVWVGNDY
jgi:uncharacterized membrane protein